MWSGTSTVKFSSSKMDGLSRNFVKGLSRRFADCNNHHNQDNILRLSIDPKPKDILPKSPTQQEKKLVDGTKHSSLLYHYRCTLVHEFREPGHGFEFDQRDTSPYYHTMSSLADNSKTSELVYPTQWFLDLPVAILTALKTHYIDTGTNPYDSYTFGSPWG